MIPVVWTFVFSNKSKLFMKIVVTGSLGHISKPLTKELVQKGHAVTVISSKPEKQKEIGSLGATAAIGSVEDADFLTATFTGADAVYTMVPPTNFFDPNLDLYAWCHRIGNNYAQAIRRSGTKRVVHLSSIGAHLEKDSGLILAHREVELILDKLSGIAITFIRPVGFYYNLLGFIPMIKTQGLIAANYGAGEHLVWVSPIDIAAAVAEELTTTPSTNKKIRYIASDELTGHETASILGAAIGKPDLKWILISNEERQRILEAVGLNPKIAAGLVEMFASQHSGLLMEDYYRNKPKLGNVKLTDFAKEFAAAFNQK
jgi:uncharacterized protein YbjT (DUF2867 family)